MDFWNRLRSELNYQDITHKELAAKLNVPKGSLESKFARENTPDAEFLYQCSKALNLSMDYLYSGNPPDGFSNEELSLINSYRTLNKEQKKLVIMLLNNLNGLAPEILPGEDNFIMEIK